MMLPKLEDFSPYTEALAQVEKQKQSIKELEKITKALQHKIDKADNAGAGYESLKSLKEELKAAQRSVVLAKRELDELNLKTEQKRQAAEEELKASARERGLKIVSVIEKAIDELEAAQKDYKTLTQELRSKVRFEKPLSGENETRYCGPGPASIFKPSSYAVEDYKESARSYRQGWPPKQKPEPRPQPPLPGKIILT